VIKRAKNDGVSDKNVTFSPKMRKRTR